jgi:hypothetical protein
VQLDQAAGLEAGWHQDEVSTGGDLRGRKVVNKVGTVSKAPGTGQDGVWMIANIGELAVS